MYKLIFALFGVLMFVIGTNAHAFGGTDNSSRASSSSRSSSGAMAGASAHQAQAAIAGASQQGNTTSVSDNSRYEATDGRDWAPAVSAPNLTTGICMGSISAGGSGAGFGLSFGKTVTDEECQIRYNSIRLEQIGQVDASTVILCQVRSMKIALRQSGYECPDRKHDNDINSAPTANAVPSTSYKSQSIIGGGMYR